MVYLPWSSGFLIVHLSKKDGVRYGWLSGRMGLGTGAVWTTGDNRFINIDGQSDTLIVELGRNFRQTKNFLYLIAFCKKG